ncbi:MAG: ATP-binding protein [Candidatus Limnocylindria bacterium]
MPRVELTLLGRFRVLVEGEERPIAARKQRALIATLALRFRLRSRERVVADLWPESDDERGRESLRHALYRIRTAVGAALVATAHDGLRIDEGVAVDVREFERAVAAGTDEDLGRALALYAGDLCPEVEGVEGEAERVRLRGLFAAAGETLAARRLETDPREAAEVARRVTEIDPYREEVQRVLLRSLAAAGDLAAAAIHYRRLTTLLRDELGVEPSAETKQLYASLGRATASQTGAHVGRPPLEPPAELIGRRTEYGRLMGIVSDAIDGRGESALVAGEAGTGKSRLLEEIAAVAARHGLRVLRAQATAAEGGLPFQLWVDALAACAAEAAALPAPWPAVLATLLPDTARGEVGAVAVELRRTRLFEGVARLLAHVAATSPTVLVLDDLHHADPDSVHLFHYVARTSRQRRLAMVVAARGVAAGSALEEARVSLEARGDLAIVPLGPLAPDEVAELLVRLGVGADQVQWLAPRIASWAGGNPFFVLEVLRALIGQARLRREHDAWTWSGPRPGADEPLAPDLPSTVRQTILTRVGALPDATRRILDLVAVLGPQTQLELIAAVAGRDELAVAEDLAPALGAGLIREAHGASVATIAFAHELVRDATYQRIPLTVRAAIHRRAAAALERSGATSRAVAFHLTAGGDAARGAEHWIASAREAEASFAHDDAIRSYRAALDALGPSAPRRSEIIMSIGDEHMRRGSAAAGVAAYEEALATLPANALDDRATLSTRIAGAARYYHRHPRALEHARAGVEHYRSRGDRERLAGALVSLAWVRYVDGEANAARELADEARIMARSLGTARIEAQALHVSIWARWLSGESLAGADPEDVERLLTSLGDDEGVAFLVGMVSTDLVRHGRPREAVAPARRALEIARRVGSLRAQLKAGEELAFALVASGSWRQAIDLADEVLADVAGLDLAGPADLLGELVIALALAGDAARAIPLAGELIADRSAAAEAPAHNSPALMAATGLMALRRLPERSLIDAERPACRTCQVGWHAVAGRLAALTGDEGRALALADDLESLTREGGQPTHAGAAEHIRALAFARAGRVEDARTATERARAAFRSADRVDAEAFLDRDLTMIAAVHA